MENNGSLMTELYDIKRQNTDWEIKLENNNNNESEEQSKICAVFDSERVNQNKMQIIISTTDDTQRNSINLNAFNNRNNSNDNGVEIFIDNNPLKLRNFPIVASDGIKNVEQYVERRKINGITWYYCKWDQCKYGSNKSNHLVRHIRTHTGEKPYECDWPNCGKKFTDSWKRKDHQLSHSRKLFSSANSMLNSQLFSSLTNYSDSSLKLFNGVYDKCDNNNDTSSDTCGNNNINFLPAYEQTMKPLNGDDVEDESECDREQHVSDCDLNMFIPEVIVSEIEEPTNTLNQNSLDETPNEISFNSMEQYVEKSVKNDRALYSCKWHSCSYTTYNTSHMVKHIRTHTNEKPFACEFPGCGKSFADLYKKKDHQLTHNRKLITSVYNNDLVKIVIDMNQFVGKNNLFNNLDVATLTTNDANEPNFSSNDNNNGFQLPITSSKLTLTEIDEQIANLNNCFVNQNVMSIKHVEPFVERRKIDNITWYFCKFPYCSYGSNKSNHLVRHVRTHTNTRPFICPFPGCSKRFTDTWKLRDHQISHNKFNFTINRQPNEDLSISICNASDNYVVADDQQKSMNGDECTDAKRLKYGHSPNYLLNNSRFNTSNAGSDVVMSIKNVEQYVERRKVNGITYYYCKWPQCTYGSNKSNHLVRHVRTHTGERPFECDECFKRFTDSWKLKDHKLIHARKNATNNFLSNNSNVVSNALVVCNNFGFDNNANNFNQLCDSKEEITIKHEAIEYNKDETDNKLDLFVPEVNVMEIKDLELTSRLNSSSVSTNGDNSCYGILSIKNVEQYVEKSFRNDSNWYICKYSPDCNFGTAKCSYIVQHIYKHTGEKPYKCNWPQCSAKFNKKQNLTLHTMSHTGEKPLRCLYPNCYYSAVNSEALEVHYRRHTGEKPYSCDWINCDSKFAGKDELLKHTKTHVGDRFYYCHYPNCTYASKYRNKLTIHIRRHTNDRPFKCRIDNCEKAFIVSDKLKRHELSVHKVQV